MNTAHLTPAVRRRALQGLLVYTFFMVIGFSMLMPLVAVYFVNNIGMATAAVGMALAVRQVLQQGLAFVGGLLSDRWGARRMIGLGVLLRALGFASLAWADAIPLLLFAMVISALGGALFEAPYQASIAAFTTEEDRPRYYAISNWVSGVATTVGPLLGVAALRLDFQFVCLAAAACFLLNFAIVHLLLPTIPMPEKPPAMRHNLQLVAQNRPFMTLIVLMMAYWFTAVQVNLSFPLQAQYLTGNTESVGIMFAWIAGLTVVLQYHLVRALERWLDARQILILGIVLMAMGAAAISLVQQFISFLLCISVFAIGALLTRPTQQTLLAQMANPKALGTFLGVSSMSLAIGGGLGNIAGGWLFDFSRSASLPWLPWLVFAVSSLLCAAGLYRLLPAKSSTQAS